ncbi:hypothetical protein LCGC14_0315990 [marine sediment metagenome]|uniref:Uncharacterized protein n=1 Tax=marine sediment metagenome TaxID=412755 RepID=A0A0F9U2Z9_9ZZZZ
MENPYNKELWPDDGPNGMRHKTVGTDEVFYTDSELTAAFNGWEEGKAEPTRIISELVEALEQYITYGHLTTTELGRRAWEKVRTVIDKARVAGG